MHCFRWEIRSYPFLCSSTHGLLFWGEGVSFKIFLSLVLCFIIIMCLVIVFFAFLVLGLHWASRICRFITVIKFTKYLSITSLTIVSKSLSLFFLNNSTIFILVYWSCSTDHSYLIYFLYVFHLLWILLLCLTH